MSSLLLENSITLVIFVRYIWTNYWNTIMFVPYKHPQFSSFSLVKFVPQNGFPNFCSKVANQEKTKLMLKTAALLWGV